MDELIFFQRRGSTTNQQKVVLRKPAIIISPLLTCSLDEFVPNVGKFMSIVHVSFPKYVFDGQIAYRYCIGQSQDSLKLQFHGWTSCLKAMSNDHGKQAAPLMAYSPFQCIAGAIFYNSCMILYMHMNICCTLFLCVFILYRTDIYIYIYTYTYIVLCIHK